MTEQTERAEQTAQTAQTGQTGQTGQTEQTEQTLTVVQIASYLTATGWLREPETWRAASIWRSADGHQVLLPARDGMGDGDLRIREILDLLARVEARPRADIHQEIGSPLTDIQTYQLFPEQRNTGLRHLTSLPAGLRALAGIRQLLDLAGRAFVEGPHVTFSGSTPRSVRNLLDRSQLGTGSAENSRFRVFVPLGGSVQEAALARGVVVQLHDAVHSAALAATEAQRTQDLSRFDDAITAGVSAKLCQALSDLSGADRAQPFEIGFTWARDQPAHPAPSTIRVAAGGGTVLARGAQHLRRLSASGPATATGLVESLHDDADRSDRWRIKVRGEVERGRGVDSRRTLWVRLAGAAAYDLAIAAHREQRPIQARGELSVVGGRLELLTEGGIFGLDPLIG